MSLLNDVHVFMLMIVIRKQKWSTSMSMSLLTH